MLEIKPKVDTHRTILMYKVSNSVDEKRQKEKGLHKVRIVLIF